MPNSSTASSTLNSTDNGLTFTLRAINDEVDDTLREPTGTTELHDARMVARELTDGVVRQRVRS